MKKIEIILLLCLFFFNCSTINRLEIKTNKSISKFLDKYDKIFVIKSIEFNKSFIWFHENGTDYYYKITPGKADKVLSINKNEILIENDTLNKYFNMKFEDPEYNCFFHEDLHTLEYDIFIYRKNEETLVSGLNFDCLFNTEFAINSLPYKLQKELYPLFKSEITLRNIP